MNTEAVNICWFRRDLRLYDNAALYYALKSGRPVIPVFIFDRNILDRLEEKQDGRVAFIHAAIRQMQDKLVAMGTTLEVYYGFPEQVFRDLLKKYRVGSVFVNGDYEPYAIERDKRISLLLETNGVTFNTFKDQVIFEKKEIAKDNGEPYSVFTPYYRCWRSRLTGFYLRPYPVEKYYDNFYRQPAARLPSPGETGFAGPGPGFSPPVIQDELLRDYGRLRDFPGVEGTSRLSVHVRFGTLSIRQLAGKALGLSDTFLKELAWRDFYQALLWNFPRIGEGKPFKPGYEWIAWRNNEAEFDSWRRGQTGYPIVDAGMRELNATGYMHNRVRMVTASFLIKHLLIDWRWGETYFAAKLLDYDMASNNGGWQWAAGCGCDAVPYFRVFNPALQARKFDPQFAYIRKWIPEWGTPGYPLPMVEHDFARKRCLETYARTLKR